MGSFSPVHPQYPVPGSSFQIKRKEIAFPEMHSPALSFLRILFTALPTFTFSALNVGLPQDAHFELERSWNKGFSFFNVLMVSQKDEILSVHLSCGPRRMKNLIINPVSNI